MKWADLVCDEASAAGLDCRVINRVHGWPETMVIEGQRCFSKSITYQRDRRLYFQGVDPKKLDEAGDAVLLCGGENGKLKDIFIIPWNTFFRTLAQGEAINTYQPPKEYWQYKYRVKSVGSRWRIYVQGGQKPELDVTQWRFSVVDAISYFREKRSAV